MKRFLFATALAVLCLPLAAKEPLVRPRTFSEPPSIHRGGPADNGGAYDRIDDGSYDKQTPTPIGRARCGCAKCDCPDCVCGLTDRPFKLTFG